MNILTSAPKNFHRGLSKIDEPERKAIVEAEDWEGPAYQTCMDAASVALLEISRRRDVLSFTHHAEVVAPRKLTVQNLFGSFLSRGCAQPTMPNDAARATFRAIIASMRADIVVY